MSARIEKIINRRLVLSYAAFDVLYCAEFGEDAVKPAGLRGLSPGATYAERIRLVEEVLANLRGRGLVKADNPVPPLLDTIRLLHGAHRRVYGWYATRKSNRETPGSFHIAESDDLAVLAQYENDNVTLKPVEWDKIHAAALELPPRSQPVPGDEVVVPAKRASAPLDKNIQKFLDPSGLRFVMQVYTARKGRRGKEIVSEFPLHYCVGEHGAVMTVHKRPDEESEPRLHVIPATRATFLATVQSL